MRNEGGDISLPPALSLSGPSDITTPVGSSIEATYTLTNVGVSPATDVEVTLEGYDLSVSPSSVDSLPPGESATLTVSGTASDVTESPLVVSAGAASSPTGLNVVDTGGHLDRALAVIDDIETHLESLSTAGNGSNGKGNGNNGNPTLNGLENKLATARDRIETVQAQLESDADESVTDGILSIRNLMGAFINQVHGLGNAHLAARDEAVLADDAATVIDELAAASRTLE